MRWTKDIFGEKKRTGDIQDTLKYRHYVAAQFRKNKRALFSVYLLYFFVFIFVFADFIANDKPLIAKHEGKIMFPVVKSYFVQTGLAKWPKGYANIDWKTLDYDFVLWPPIPYGSSEQDASNPSVSPGGNQEIKNGWWRHWFGTDVLGRDLLAGMIHATRIDLSIGIVAMGVAALIGILLGSLAGFFGDTKLKISRGRLILNLGFLFVAWFYAFSARSFAISDAAASSFGAMIVQLLISFIIFGTIMGIANLLSNMLKRISFFAKKIALPLDITISRAIEVVVSVPVIFLIIMILAIVEKGSIFWVMVIIGLTRWTGIARFIRAELLRIRSLEYIEAANALGFSQLKILVKHAIPNSLAPVFIAIAFGIASTILIEAFLSFIGLGVPPDVPTWGSLLNAGRQSPTEWWMALFPGLAIFITVTLFNLIGEGLTDALDPREKK